MNTWRKEIIQWRSGKTLYLSIPFTWMLEEAKRIAQGHKGKVIAGGPAVKLMGCDWAETSDTCPFDVLAMHNPCATFTTRGCTNACAFCAVPKIEGEFRELQTWKPAPVVCDNNILAASKNHFIKVIDSLTCFPEVDFNQGLEARILKPWHIEQMQRLRGVKIRFALDHTRNMPVVSDAIARCKAAGFRDFGVYVLIGFNDTPADALERLEFVRSLGIWPNPMRYQPLGSTEKNAYVAQNWTALELKRMMRYYSRLRWLEHIPYSDYCYTGETGDLFEAI
jgi:hypothetical protein